MALVESYAHAHAVHAGVCVIPRFQEFNVSILRFRNVTFEITSTDVGTFDVSGKFMGVSMEKVELVFQVRGLV